VSDEALSKARQRALEDPSCENLCAYRKLRDRAGEEQPVKVGMIMVRLWPPHDRLEVLKIKGGYAWVDHLDGDCTHLNYPPMYHKTSRVALVKDYMEWVKGEFE
jgi:hypothetical protein